MPRARFGLAALSLTILMVAVVTQLLTPPAALADDWRTYHNDRYGTTIDYPSVFKPGTPPGNDDGLAFTSADGAEFSVFASYNALDFDLAGFQDFVAKNLGADAVITYRAHGDDRFVISGTKGSDRIFYERHLLSHGKEMTEGFVSSSSRNMIRSSRACRNRSAPVAASRRRRSTRSAFPWFESYQAASASL